MTKVVVAQCCSFFECFMLLSMLTLSKNGHRGPVAAKFGHFWPVFDLFWSQSPLVGSAWALRWLLNCLSSLTRSLSNMFELYMALVPPHTTRSCQNCCNVYPKMSKMNAKQESLLLSHNLSHLDGCLNFIKSCVRSQSTVLGHYMMLDLCALPIHAKIVAVHVPKTSKWSPNQRCCVSLDGWLTALYPF